MSIDARRSEAARVATNVELRDVRLFEAETRLSFIPDERERRLRYGFNADVNVQHSREQSILVVMGDYQLDVHVHKDEESDDDESDENVTEVAVINFKMNALFEVEDEPEEEPFTESEMIAFGETTGQFAIYPYAREFIASLTGRMGLPPLHLGLMRIHLESRTGD